MVTLSYASLEKVSITSGDVSTLELIKRPISSLLSSLSIDSSDLTNTFWMSNVSDILDAAMWSIMYPGIVKVSELPVESSITNYSSGSSWLSAINATEPPIA